jgi:hypothetical protein
MKGQNDCPVARCTLRKHCDTITGLQLLGGGFDHRMHRVTPTTLNKNRSRSGAEKTHQRPSTNFGLGNEMTRCDGIDHQDIEPADMVCQNQTRMLEVLSGKPDPNTRSQKGPTRPAPNQSPMMLG